MRVVMVVGSIKKNIGHFSQHTCFNHLFRHHLWSYKVFIKYGNILAFMFSSLFSNCKLIASAYTFYCECESEEMRDELLCCALLHFIVSFFLTENDSRPRECREVVSPVKLIMQLFFLNLFFSLLLVSVHRIT